MSRSVPEWRGATPDTPVPHRVRVRVRVLGGNACANCKRDLAAEPAECDHIIALINGGENRESNLQALCEWCHKPKTVFDVAEKSRAYKRRKRHYGLRKAKSPFKGWRKFSGEAVRNPKAMRRNTGA
jgi:5-methylcytosine-specific restriction protein A